MSSPIHEGNDIKQKMSSKECLKEQRVGENPQCQPSCNSADLEMIEAHLETKELWEKFYSLGTEMIITKTGRSVYPFLVTYQKILQSYSKLSSFSRIPFPKSTLRCPTDHYDKIIVFLSTSFNTGIFIKMPKK